MDTVLDIPTMACSKCSSSMKELAKQFDEKINRIQLEFNIKLHGLISSLSAIEKKLGKLQSELVTINNIKTETIKTELINCVELDPIESCFEPDTDIIDDNKESLIVSPYISPDRCDSPDEPSVPHSRKIAVKRNDDDDFWSKQNDNIVEKKQKPVVTEEMMNELLDTESNWVTKMYLSKKSTKCLECGEIIKSGRSLVSHMINVHGKNKPYKCKKCSSSFMHRHSFKDHCRVPHDRKPVKAEKDKYICDYCPKLFNDRSVFRAHHLTHTREKHVQCDICLKMFSLKHSLRTHMRIHTNERPSMCEICSKSFRSQGALYQHRKMHTDIRPHKCPLCGRAFRTTAHLLVHSYSHTGERPVACPICRQGFTKRYHVKKHLRNFHKVDNVDEVFPRPSSLKV